jgi:hypothetical protein
VLWLFEFHRTQRVQGGRRHDQSSWVVRDLDTEVARAMRNLIAGALAGLIAAAVPGLLLQLTTTTTPDGTRTSTIEMAAHIVRSNHPSVGWLVVLAYGAVVGTLFGRLVRGHNLTTGLAVVAGCFYGVGWWILSGLVVVPAVLGLVPLSSAAVDLMHPVALRTMIVSVLYGAALGAVVTMIATRSHRIPAERPTQEHMTRAA